MRVIRITYRYGLYKKVKRGKTPGCYIMSRRNQKYISSNSGPLSKEKVAELNLLKCTNDEFNRIGLQICNVPIE